MGDGFGLMDMASRSNRRIPARNNRILRVSRFMNNQSRIEMALAAQTTPMPTRLKIG